MNQILLGGMSMFWMSFIYKDSRLRPFRVTSFKIMLDLILSTQLPEYLDAYGQVLLPKHGWVYYLTWMGILSINIEHVVKEHLFIAEDRNRWGMSGFQVDIVLNSTALLIELMSNYLGPGKVISDQGKLFVHWYLVFPLSQLRNTININKVCRVIANKYI